jgi:hypothetical protein
MNPPVPGKPASERRKIGEAPRREGLGPSEAGEVLDLEALLPVAGTIMTTARAPMFMTV